MFQRSTKGLAKTNVSQNSIFLLAQIAITSILGIFNSIFLINGLRSYYLLLSEDIYGRMSFIQNITIIFTPILYLGFLLTLTKKVAEQYAINDEFIACTVPDREVDALMAIWPGNRNRPINRINSYVSLMKVS